MSVHCRPHQWTCLGWRLGLRFWVLGWWLIGLLLPHQLKASHIRYVPLVQVVLEFISTKTFQRDADMSCPNHAPRTKTRQPSTATKNQKQPFKKYTRTHENPNPTKPIQKSDSLDSWGTPWSPIMSTSALASLQEMSIWGFRV